ncbi:hypothetical protein SBI_05305 [Streptomyces bingchenggensis BCW-1]|uniref:Uncharacterized protein n=1 Tax=Streptomyces bingchenggensis (strain BCW-1) TaxID=749414 RepID=D7C738_STRBB|nr:hypothetical protein SBI_05305 [Streptomyces bingchenggensis BCW-1]
MAVPPEQISESVPDAASTSDLRLVPVRIAHRLRRAVNATRGLLRRVRQVIVTGRGRHSAVYMAARPAHTPVPPPRPVAIESPAPSSVFYEDPPTLRLPRIPAAERFPIVWDADPVGLYVVQYERERALGVAR